MKLNIIYKTTNVRHTMQHNIKIDDQIIFSKNEGLFIGRVVEVREKSIKVDYCWESVWNKCQMTIYNYTTFIPISQVITTELGDGCFTTKKWWQNNINPEKVFHIKKYFIDSNGQKSFL